MTRSRTGWMGSVGLAIAVGLACGGGTSTLDIAPLPPVADLGPRDAACMIDGEIAPSLVPIQEGASVDVSQAVGRTVESFTFPDGTPVRFEQGGCVHFGMTLTVGLVAEPQDRFTEAVRQMDRVVFVDGEETLKQALSLAEGLDDMGYFPCGDASCDVRVHADADGVRLVVGYDFPL